MTAQIKIPDSVADMNLSHLPFFLALARLTDEVNELTDLTPAQISDLNCLFFNEMQGAFDIYDTPSNLLILAELVASCKKIKPQKIPPSYTIDGVTYVWQTDYTKQPVSFHRDISRVDWEENPIDLLAFCYIEEGMMYNELNEKTKTIINPKRERAKAFEDKVNLQAYLDVQGFFLESYNALRPYLKAKEARQRKQSGTGKKV